MTETPLDDLPGFRRRFRITPAAGVVRAEVEDDFHHMVVDVRHDGAVATGVEAGMVRAPWTTCPGAVAVLQKTFTGLRLDAFPGRGVERPSNCTHLYDLALLAAAHAHDPAPTVYDILVSDPVEGRREAELRRGGVPILTWAYEKHRLIEPAHLAGRSLRELGGWIASLAPAEQEAARLLRWGSFLADGRIIPLEAQSDATKMPAGSCFTFQPDVAAKAIRVGEIRDFSRASKGPLAED